MPERDPFDLDVAVFLGNFAFEAYRVRLSYTCARASKMYWTCMHLLGDDSEETYSSSRGRGLLEFSENTGRVRVD